MGITARKAKSRSRIAATSATVLTSGSEHLPAETEAIANSRPHRPLMDAWQYQIDFWQRSVLFLDALRERGNNMLAHEGAGLPPLLNYQYDMILDARQFERPVNYALLKINAAGDACVEDCAKKVRDPSSCSIHARATVRESGGSSEIQKWVWHCTKVIPFTLWSSSPIPAQDRILRTCTTRVAALSPRSRGAIRSNRQCFTAIVRPVGQSCCSRPIAWAWRVRPCSTDLHCLIGRVKQESIRCAWRQASPAALGPRT